MEKKKKKKKKKKKDFNVCVCCKQAVCYHRFQSLSLCGRKISFHTIVREPQRVFYDHQGFVDMGCQFEQ